MRTYEVTLCCTVVRHITADTMDEAMDEAYNEANQEYENLDFDVEDAQCISSGDGKRIYRDAMDYYDGVA